MPNYVGFRDYFRTAFSAKPFGMFVSPNWLMLAAFGLLGVAISPGFLVLGSGVELAYLFTLAVNPRFQRYVHGLSLSEESAHRGAHVLTLVNRLSPEAKARFARLQERCSAVLDFYASQSTLDAQGTRQHNQSLNKLLWIFLQLLMARQAIAELMKGTIAVPKFRAGVEDEIRALDARKNARDISPELRKSMEGTRNILAQRLQTLTEAENKIAYIDLEMDRIEQQVELIREQAAVSNDAQLIATRVDTVSASLGEATEWIKQQQNLFGSIQDIVEEPPPLLPPQRAVRGAQ